MTTRSTTESIIRPIMVLMSGRVLGFVAAFVMPVILVRLFSQSDFGTYKQLFLVYATLYGIAQLGMAESLFYFLPAAERRGGRYVLNAILVLSVAGALCVTVLWVASSNIAHWFNNPALAGYLPFIGIYILLMLMSTVLEIVMTSRNRYKHASISYALTDFCRATLFIVPVFWFGQLQYLLYGAITFALLRVVATFFYLRQQYGVDLTLDSSVAHKQWAYALTFSVYVTIDVLQINLHQYAVSYHFDAATFAIYAVGCLSIPLVDFLTSSAGNVMMVRMREYLLKESHYSMLKIWHDTTRQLMLVFAPLVACLLVVAHELIVVLFTANYADSVPIFVVWTMTFLLAAFMTDSVLRVYSEIRFLLFLGISKLVLIAATINWFLNMFGLVGAVLVMVMTILVTKSIAIFRIKKVMQCGFSEVLPWQSLATIMLVAAIATLPALVFKLTFIMPDLPRMIMCGLIYSASYLGLLWGLGVIRGNEKRILIGWAMRLTGNRHQRA